MRNSEDNEETGELLPQVQSACDWDSRVILVEASQAAYDATELTDNHLVVYREAELRELAGKTPKQLRKIHEVKKAIE